MAFFGVELNAQINKILTNIKLTLNKNKYYPNFRTIYRAFVNFDSEQSGIVNIEQMDKALQKNGIFLKKYELQAIQKAFNEDGRINWFGLMSTLREPMNAYRAEVIDKIFDSIDAYHAGQIHYS